MPPTSSIGAWRTPTGGSTSSGRGYRNRLGAATGFAALLVLPALADPTIEVTRKPAGGFQLTLEVGEAIDVDEGLLLLLPTAVQLCDPLRPQFGEYEFAISEAVETESSDDSFVLVQDIECGGVEPAESKPPSRQLRDHERREVERVARARLVDYHSALASGDDGAALAMFPSQSPWAPAVDAWREEQAAFRAKAGQLDKVDVWQVTVYVDPPGEPGIFVATDFEISYENMTVCGYFVWFEDADGAFRITRREVGEITADVISKMSESQLARVRIDFRCPPASELD